jgi:hypothetical protein
MNLNTSVEQYSSVGSLFALRQSGASASVSSAKQGSAETTHAHRGDAIVALSPAARQLAETGLPAWVNEKMEKLSANSDQDEAMRWVEEMYATPSVGGPLVAIHEGPNGAYYTTYTYTGERVTPESEARYMAIQEASLAETSRLVAAGKAKGAAAAEIFAQISRHLPTLPDDYLRQINWYRK